MVTSIPPKFVFTYDNMTVNVFHVNKGEGIPKHNHNYSHATLCTNGSIVIRKDNSEKVCNKDTGPINLKDIEYHEIESLEDGTVFLNIFATQFKDELLY
jgi:quercetin dioxygenase-like cupin family protein